MKCPSALVAVLCGLVAAACPACRQDMYNQPKYKPLQPSEFFADGTSARPLPPHTVARGYLNEDAIFFQGKHDDGQLAESFPMPVTRELLARGQERYTIFCAVCHGAEGDGNGMIVQRGFPAPNSYHIDRLRQAPPGYFYNVITHGYGVMYSYASRVEPADRWAIAAYVRALQLSRNGRLDDVPASERPKLEGKRQAVSETTTFTPPFRLRRLCLMLGVALLGVSAVGLCFNPKQFFFSYLFGFVFWIGLPLGSLCVLMIHYLTGGGWGYVIRRFLEASFSTLPWMALLFLPILAGLHYLYPWTDPAVVSATPTMQKVGIYLNTPALIGRSVIFFACWIAFAARFRRLSLRQDQTTDPTPTRQARTLSGPGLLVFALTVSLALVDWVMVLERNWYSTVFPVQLIIGQILLTFAFCTVMLAWVTGPAPFGGRGGPLGEAVRVEHFHSLGNFLLAFVMLWGYLTVSQLIIIWSGNLPREVTWYLHHVAGGWRWLAIFVGLFYFALPFFVLLSRENKQSVRLLRGLAVGIIFMHAVEVWWQIAPSLHQQGIVLSWMDIVAWLGIGGIWLGVFLTNLDTRLTLPKSDPRMLEALIHGH